MRDSTGGSGGANETPRRAAPVMRFDYKTPLASFATRGLRDSAYLPSPSGRLRDGLQVADATRSPYTGWSSALADLTPRQPFLPASALAFCSCCVASVARFIVDVTNEVR